MTGSRGLVDSVLQLGRPFGSLFSDGGSVYALVGFFYGIQYAAIARFLKYVDLRTRKEGWDIQIRFLSLVAAQDAREGRAA